MLQHTIKKQISFNGFGIHTAKFAEVSLFPLPDDAGIVFRSNSVAKPYRSENVSGDARGTQLILDEQNRILTIEHLVSAIAGLGIDNLLIDVDGPEVPIKDGSPKFFIDKLLEAGIKEQQKEKSFLKIQKKIVLQEKDKAIVVLPADIFKIHFLINYPDDIVQADLFSFDFTTQDYAQDLGSARTYGFEEEIEYLWNNDKALGATLQNAIVISPQGYSQALRYPDELVRHKVVDFIGDIFALGKMPLGEFFVMKSGHEFNQKLVQELLR